MLLDLPVGISEIIDRQDNNDILARIRLFLVDEVKLLIFSL